MKYLKLLPVFILTLFVITQPQIGQAANFSPQQVKDHPCLSQVPIPWHTTPAKKSDLPDAYKDWPSVFAGYFGGTLCHALIIQKISPDGTVKFLYSIDAVGNAPAGYGNYIGVISEIDGVQHLKATLASEDTKVEYILEWHKTPTASIILIIGSWQNKYSKTPSIGTFKPVTQE